MTDIVRTIAGPKNDGGDVEGIITREWLVTNGLGGYSSGTLAGLITRRYHGLLVAALPAPHGRMVMLSQLSEQIRLPDGRIVRFGTEERIGGKIDVQGAHHLVEFRLEMGIPVWRYRAEDFVFERRITMPYLNNTVCITYHLIEGSGSARLKLRPSIHFRSYEDAVNADVGGPYTLNCREDRYELIGANHNLPPLRMQVHGHRVAFTVEGSRVPEMLYRVEESRGYTAIGDLYTPGYFRSDFGNGQDVSLIASTEAWDLIEALSAPESVIATLERHARLISLAPAKAQSGPSAELTLAADQFIIVPAARRDEVMRARAAGEEARTIIAGYHWFTDWGRDTMISLEGLALCTSRHREGAYILKTFLHHVRDGLIPNMFPDGASEGLYHTADATLWMFHAVHRHSVVTGDLGIINANLQKLYEIAQHHLLGTRFGIHVDPKDGLLVQGEEGYQLTWMDAKVDGWVVTPRRGKAVEINALWYNALRLLEGWLRAAGREDDAKSIGGHAEHARESFNQRFWSDSLGHLYDVVDGEHGDDSACRPNQIFAISLDNPVLIQDHWKAVYDVVAQRLLTPVGLRSLDPGHPDFKPTYHGDLRTRDAAYHQGTVWAWLIGPFVDVHLKLNPEDKPGARAFLQGLVDHIDDYGVGTIAEVFDAEPPFTPRGCIAQAWSVAEVLRCLVRTSA
jgi:predicted glycogen debranching enzyme